MKVPDGEYTLSLSEGATQLLSSGPSADSRGGAELMNLRYTDKPENIDETQTRELDVKGDVFELLAASKNPGEKLKIEGSVSSGQEIECVIIYNKEDETFELQAVERSLLATSSMTMETKPRGISHATSLGEKKPVKKRKDAPSIFQPKARPRSPLELSGGIKRGSALVSLPVDEDVPLSKVTPKRQQSTKPSAPSPLASPYQQTSPLKKSESTSTLSQRSPLVPSMKKSQSTTTKQPAIKPSAPPLRNQKKPTSTIPKGQVSGKRPPSSATTPTITQETPSSDEEFESLVDELEEQLLSDDGFIQVEEGTAIDTQKQRAESFTSEVKATSPLRRPINLRMMAGVEDDEENVTSSEEE